MKKVLVLFMVTALAAVSQAVVVIDSFVNIDFDSGTVTSWPFKGFDAPWATEIIGWTNYPSTGPLNDAGVEGPGAWWLTPAYTDVYQNAGFMSSGDAAYTMSSYTIQAGDVFFIKYMAGVWGWTGTGQWTASLFYNHPDNVFGSYVQNINSWMPNGVWYSDSIGIPATPAAVGGTLGILLRSTGTGIVQIDEITVSVVPEPTTMALLGLGTLALLRKRK